MEPLFEVQTVLTESLYRDCCQLKMRRNPIKFASFGCGLLFLGVGLLSLIAEYHPFTVVLSVFAGIFLFFYPKLLERIAATRMLKTMKRILGHPRILRFYDTYFTETSAHGEARIPYADLYQIREDNVVLLLLLNRVQMVVIEKQRMPAGMAERLVEHIRSQTAAPYRSFH